MLINKLFILAILPIMNLPPAQGTNLDDFRTTVHETRTMLREQNQKLKEVVNKMDEKEMEKISEDLSFLGPMSLYMKAEELLELDLMLMEIAAAKYGKPEL